MAGKATRNGKLRNAHYSLNDAFCIFYLDDHWLELSVNSSKGSLGETRKTGRALRTTFENELPAFLLAYKLFSSNNINNTCTIQVFEQTKNWWLTNADSINMHFNIAYELGVSHEERQTYVALALGLLTRSPGVIDLLPDDLTYL